jgi:hypothetical protein
VDAASDPFGRKKHGEETKPPLLLSLAADTGDWQLLSPWLWQLTTFSAVEAPDTGTDTDTGLSCPCMVEVLVIFGLVGWLFLTFLESLSSLPFFPALVAAAVLCPVLSIRDYSYLRQAWKLRGISSKRDPIPPERFYWGTQKARLRRIYLFFGILSAFAWCNAAVLPASSELSVASIVGWLNALVGILTLSRVISTATLFFNASQWFDAMSPKIVGMLRQAMYKLSDNYEYLAPKRRDPEKEEVY